MTVTFRKLHPHVGAEVSPIDLRQCHDRATLEKLRAGMDAHGVLVFRNQPFTDAEQLAFAERFDGTLHVKPGAAALAANRFGNDAVADISNVDNSGNILKADDRKRVYSLGNRLWHTDASFQDPAGRYSTLSARVIPKVNANTEFADMRAAYDALGDTVKQKLEGLKVHHTITRSREVLGFFFSEAEKAKLQGAIHPIVRVNPRTGRKSLYLAAHAARIIDWPVADGLLFVMELMEHATQREFVFSHEWRDGDFVIWDNLATMHRATAFDDATHHRELRRVTTIDVPLVVGA
jgi:alpha-ketoglutarate-dependent 2,4-dichlorophenoxyacetate dioxygenase